MREMIGIGLRMLAKDIEIYVKSKAFVDSEYLNTTFSARLILHTNRSSKTGISLWVLKFVFAYLYV